jgi:hypothetical protein
MLYKDPFIINPTTFSLIQELQSLPFLKDFYLVGGTALALKLGHRNSIDIDLFTQNEFSTREIAEKLSLNRNFFISFERENTLMCYINSIKTDFIRHNYSFVNEPITEEGITYLSMEDIAAMKLNAIAQSGKRIKDFIDVYYLLEHFSVNEMLSFYEIKYPFSNKLIALRGLEYFNDIDLNIDPPILKKPLPLLKIQKRIKDGILHLNKKF